MKLIQYYDIVLFSLIMHVLVINILCDIILGVLRYPPIANYSDMNYFRSQISILSDGRYLVGAM